MSVFNPETLKEFTAKDFEKILLNYFTGKFDLALAYNTDRIVTHEYNEAGTLIQFYDTVYQVYLPAGPQVVVDNEGHVIQLGSGRQEDPPYNGLIGTL